jgi:hypothetical protein
MHELESKHRVTSTHVGLPRGGTVAAEVHILTSSECRERVEALALFCEALLEQRAIAASETIKRFIARIVEQQHNELGGRPEHVTRVFARILPDAFRQRISFITCSTHDAIAREHVCKPELSAPDGALTTPLAF